ncbi:hypothetical protein EMIT093MI4_190015 [Pseudomonas sp. IT-93MI4]
MNSEVKNTLRSLTYAAANPASNNSSEGRKWLKRTAEERGKGKAPTRHIKEMALCLQCGQLSTHNVIQITRSLFNGRKPGFLSDSETKKPLPPREQRFSSDRVEA